MASDLTPTMGRIPQVRPMIRGGRPRSERRPRQGRWLNYLVPVGIVLFNVALAWTDDQTTMAAWAIPLVFGVAMAMLFEICRRNDMIAAGCLLILTELAYIFGAGHALSFGTSAGRSLYAPPDAVASALINLMMSLGEIVLGALVLDRMMPKSIRNPQPVERPRTRQAHFLALLLLVMATFLAAFLAGTWSAYGVQLEQAKQDAVEAADFRWQMLYEQVLIAGIAVIVDDLIRTVERRGRLSDKKAMLFVLSIFSFLLFIKQVRRFMALSLVLTILQVFGSSHIRARLLSRPLRLAGWAIIAMILPVMLNFGSLAWRRSSRVFHTTNVVDRVADAASRLNDVDEEELQNTSHRFTYLSVDAAAIAYRPMITGVLEISDLFTRTWIHSVPKVIFRGKARYLPPTCETAFRQVDPSITDMACSSTAEGFIASGLLGVFIVSLPFAILCAVASVLMRRRTVVGIFMGVQILTILTGLEGGAFGPAVFALRGALMAGFGLYAFVLVMKTLPIGWSPTTTSGARRRTPLRPGLQVSNSR